MKDFTIGADPEFCVQKKGQTIEAYETMESKYFYDNKKSRYFGLDGSEVIFEIRPPPSKCPIVLTRNIKNILQNMPNCDLINNYKWVANPYNYYLDESMGGHIHCGIKLEKYPYRHICRYLDISMMPIISSIIPIDSMLNRIDTGYGDMIDGNYRINKHGFEYRNLPTWLAHPNLTLLSLSLFKIYVYEYINKDKRCVDFVNSIFPFKNNKYDHAEYMVENVIEYNRSNKELIKNVFNFTRGCILYPKYKNIINFAKNMINKNIKFNINADMRDTWGLKLKKVKVSKIWR